MGDAEACSSDGYHLRSLLSLLSAQRHHSFVLTPAEPEPRLDEALLLQARAGRLLVASSN